MGNIDFSVVVTVLNEENTVVPLLDSLIHQSKRPKEIVVVDAGSHDATVDLVHDRLKEAKIKHEVFIKPGMNRSQARNYGIEQADFEHVAIIDAGCEADGRWLEELSMGYEGSTQAVAGFYLPVINQPIQRLYSAYVATSAEDFDAATYLPSSRSLAITKQVWRQVGKYPAHLNTCEDLVFAANLKATGKMSVRQNALVYWQQAGSLAAFFKQLQGYARGDVEAWYKPHLIKILTVYARYVAFLVFPPLFAIYLVYPFVKHGHMLNGSRELLALPFIQITSDWAVMTGAVIGLWTQVRKIL